MKHTEFAIELLLDTLQTRCMADRTPKKYSVPMFEAWEVIRQLQKEIALLKDLALPAKSPAVSAWIERMNPIAPVKDSLADRSCPFCNAYINWDALNDPVTEAPKHCKNCGQAFDWAQEPRYDEIFI